MNEPDHDADESEQGADHGYDLAAARARQRHISATERAEESYSRAYLSAVDLAQEITELLQDVPAPSENFTPTWEHVGSLVEVTRRLEAVVAFLTGGEEEGR